MGNNIEIWENLRNNTLIVRSIQNPQDTVRCKRFHVVKDLYTSYAHDVRIAFKPCMILGCETPTKFNIP